jgi:hypothetical protein
MHTILVSRLGLLQFVEECIAGNLFHHVLSLPLPSAPLKDVVQNVETWFMTSQVLPLPVLEVNILLACCTRLAGSSWQRRRL